MKGYKTISLKSRLPVITVSSFEPFTILSRENVPTHPSQAKSGMLLKTADYQPQWVKNRVRLGNLGEMIAYLYLKKVYGGDVTWASAASDSQGYDFETNGYYYEVKTSGEHKDSAEFFLSYNELQTFLKYRERYRILYIQIDEPISGITCMKQIKNDMISMFCIVDLYARLYEYQQTMTTYSAADGLISIKPDSIRIEMSHSLLEPIEYSFAEAELGEINRFFENSYAHNPYNLQSSNGAPIHIQ